MVESVSEKTGWTCYVMMGETHRGVSPFGPHLMCRTSCFILFYSLHRRADSAHIDSLKASNRLPYIPISPGGLPACNQLSMVYHLKECRFIFISHNAEPAFLTTVLGRVAPPRPSRLRLWHTFESEASYTFPRHNVHQQCDGSLVLPSFVLKDVIRRTCVVMLCLDFSGLYEFCRRLQTKLQSASIHLCSNQHVVYK